jgi:hypothetical protein
MCLLALLDEVDVEAEVAYFELGFVAPPHRFARRVIAATSRRVTLLRPHSTFVAAGNASADIAYRFNLSSGDSFEIVGATFEDQAERVSCGLDAELVREGAHDPYGWDLIISGRRGCDIDPTVGSLAINDDLVTLEHGAQVVMPIRGWSDEDVAYYLSIRPEWGADRNRYVLNDNKLISRLDPSRNPDWLPICVRCLTSTESEAPACPMKLNRCSNIHRIEDRRQYASGAVPATTMF